MIAARTKAEKAEICCGDETGVGNRGNFGRGFSEKARPPVLPMETKHERVNMISTIAPPIQYSIAFGGATPFFNRGFSITNQDLCRFMVHEEKINQKLLLDFYAVCALNLTARYSGLWTIFVSIMEKPEPCGWKIIGMRMKSFFYLAMRRKAILMNISTTPSSGDVHSGDLPHTVKDIKGNAVKLLPLDF